MTTPPSFSDSAGSGAFEGQVALFTQRLVGIRQRITQATRRASRQPQEVTLLAVSKTHPLEALQVAMAAGMQDFGESRIQEALPKVEALAPKGARFHLIGHLQRNKVNGAVGNFELIHSVDSARLLAEIQRRAAHLGLVQRILLQVNVSGEASKSGVAPAGLGELLEELGRSSNVQAQGLMTIPPYDLDSEQARPCFRQLRELMQAIPAGLPNFEPRHLSMGMSGDFEVAIEEGATIVRVGTALFGERDYSL